VGYFADHGADETNLIFKPLPVHVADGAPPQAIYLCTIKATQAVSKAGNDMVTVVLTVDEPEEFEYQQVSEWFLFFRKSLCGKTFHKLAQIMGEEWVDELGGNLVNDIIPTIVSGIDGMQVAVKLGQKKEKYLGETRTKNLVREYFDQTVYFAGVEAAA